MFNLLGVLAEMLLVPVFSFYFLVDWPKLLHRIEHMVPPRRRRDVREVAREIDGVVAGWVRGQAIVTTILAMLYATGFTVVGMPLSLPIGLLVGALTVIPFVGTFVGAAIAVLVTIADGGSMQTLGLVGGVILCLHLLEAGILTPKIVGHRVGLSESGALVRGRHRRQAARLRRCRARGADRRDFAVVVRYAVRYYEHTTFFGRESDADIVIAPAMAIRDARRAPRRRRSSRTSRTPPAAPPKNRHRLRAEAGRDPVSGRSAAYSFARQSSISRASFLKTCGSAARRLRDVLHRELGAARRLAPADRVLDRLQARGLAILATAKGDSDHEQPAHGPHSS